MGYVLGIDLGTGSLKGLLVDKQGNTVAEATAEYPLLTPAQGYSEQDPQLWIKAAEIVIADILVQEPSAKQKLEGISFSGQMHSLVLLDEEDKVVRNAILWNDVRTTEQCEEITTQLKEKLTAITKNKALEGFTLPKLLWVKKHEVENWQKAKTFLLPKDYLGFWLTGKKHMDYSDAAGTLLLDIEKKEWSKEILEIFEISATLCPALVPSIGQTGVMLPTLAEKFGFTQQVRIFAGGADNACAAIGAGILSTNIAMASIGTSGVYLSYEEDITNTYHGALHFFNHGVTNKAYSMGVTLSAGNSLSWFRKTFAPELPYEGLLKDINSIPAGCEGLVFTPYIMGERTPYADSLVRGSFTGIDVAHTRLHFTKAVLEGITFSLKDCREMMKNIAGKVDSKVVSVGGGAKNSDWLQMQADIFDCEVVTLQKEEGPALGAAMIAAVGLDWFDDLLACAKDFVSYKNYYQPNKERVEEYQKIYQSYKKVYPALKML